MSNNDVVRAWKDPTYRKNLSPAVLAALPANPAGAIELDDEALGHVSGGKPDPTRHEVTCTAFHWCVVC
jgi:mersacidin/lichenicidin family type 2 lantibiotic